MAILLEKCVAFQYNVVKGSFFKALWLIIRQKIESFNMDICCTSQHSSGCIPS